MPAVKMRSLPETTRPCTSSAMAWFTAAIRARHSSVSSALTGGRARRSSRMGPWLITSMSVVMLQILAWA